MWGFHTIVKYGASLKFWRVPLLGVGAVYANNAGSVGLLIFVLGLTLLRLSLCGRGD